MSRQGGDGSMACEEVRSRLAELCRGWLFPADSARVRGHLTCCSGCMESLSRHVAAEVAAGHPEYVEVLEEVGVPVADWAEYALVATSEEGMEVVEVDWAKIEREWLEQKEGDVDRERE